MLPDASKLVAKAGRRDFCSICEIRLKTCRKLMSRRLSLASTDFDTPIGFGLLTCDDDEQAQARAGGAHGNKGWDAALAALEMADLFDRLDVTDES